MKKLNLFLVSAFFVLHSTFCVGQQTNLMPILLTGTVTNVSLSSAYISIYGAGITNQPYTASNGLYYVIGDPFPVAFAKVNSNEQFLASQIAANTNTVSVLNFTNSVLSSHYFTLFVSNNFVFTGSNYLGSFPQLQSWQFGYPTAGPGGLTPNTNSIENLYGSTNSGSTWFLITNATPNITNTIMLSAVGDSNAAPGSITLQGIDHPELVGRTNYMDGQFNQFPDARLPQDAVNLETLNLILGNTLNGQFVASQSNNVTYSTLSENGQPVITIGSPNFTLPSSLSVSGTNLLLKISTTNFVTGWKITASTNLAQMFAWPVFTNYTMATNTGIVTFTIPKPTFTTYFFWPQGPALNSLTITPPLTLLGGTIYPSNSWSLYSVTNVMVNGQFWTGNSNGVALVALYLSNGIPIIKQIAP